MEQTIQVKTHLEKPEKFKGDDFKRWQQKMLFYLTTLNLAHILKEDCPATPEKVTKETVSATEAWKHSDFLCRNYVLNGLDDSLYNVYSQHKTSKALWESLENKYKTEDAGTKKFIVGRFLDLKMVDTKPVVTQVEELQIIINQIHSEGMTISESFQVASIIEKLPPSWRDFKNYLKHKRKELSMEDLIVRLRIEEDNRKGDKGSGESQYEEGANIVEGHAPNGNKKRNSNNNSKGKNHKTTNIINKKIKGSCWVCGKAGHRAVDCRHRKDQNSGNNNHGKGNHANMVDTDMLAAMVSESLMVTDTKEWWIDTGATRHICADRKFFSTYHKAEDGEKLFMGNASQSEVAGKGKVILKFTSGKELALLDVLHVPEIRKNLMSGSLLSKKGFKLVFESDKFVLTKGGMFVGKGYLCDGLFKLNVNFDSIIINKSVSSSYIVELCDVWHARLGHVNYRSLQRMANLGLIPKFDLKKNNKCETCVESKYHSKSFPSVVKSNDVLDLIHTDLCDLKLNPTRGGNKYFITFIDDCSKFCYIYLLKSKDEALNMFKTYKAEVENQLSKTIKVLRSDRGGEYESTEFSEFCELYGIVHQTTAPYTPQQNGVAERKNRTIKDMVNSMLNSSGAPHHLWGMLFLRLTQF